MKKNPAKKNPLKTGPAWARDTFTRGAICGLVGGAIKDLLDFALALAGIERDYFWNYTGAIAFFRLPKSPVEVAFDIVLELLFSALLGVLLCMIHQRARTRQYILFGIFFGSIVWFIIRTGVLAFHITLLQEANESAVGAISEWVLSMFWGATVAWLEHRLYRPEG